METSVRTAWNHSHRAVLKARVDTSRLCVSSVLTFPGKDLVGDIVDPTGLDFSRHAADPAIDLEHRKHPEVGGLIVAWARESLSEPGAPYALEWHDLDISPNNRGDIHRLPVGKSYFDGSDRISSQVFALVERDILPGVSLEFYPVMGHVTRLAPVGKCYTRADVVRWTHCAHPVNASALTIQKSLPVVKQVPDELVKVLTDRRVGAEPMCEVIYKALAHHLPGKSATVRVEKAMPKPNDDQYDATQTAYDTDAQQMDTSADTGVDAAGEANMEGTDAGPPAKPTVQAHYDVAQALMDCIEHAKTVLEQSEHIKGKQKLLKNLAKLEAMAEDIQSDGDGIDAEVSGKTGDVNEDDADEDGDGDEDETDDTESDDEASESDESEKGSDESEDEEGDKKKKKAFTPKLPRPIQLDSDGILEGVRPVYKAQLVKRFRMADLKPVSEQEAEDAETVTVTKTTPELADDHEETLEETIARLKQEDPEGFESLVVPAVNRLNKVKSWAS